MNTFISVKYCEAEAAHSQEQADPQKQLFPGKGEMKGLPYSAPYSPTAGRAFPSKVPLLKGTEKVHKIFHPSFPRSCFLTWVYPDFSRFLKFGGRKGQVTGTVGGSCKLNSSLESNRPWLKPVVWPLPSYFTSLIFNFPFHKMGAGIDPTFVNSTASEKLFLISWGIVYSCVSRYSSALLFHSSYQNCIIFHSLNVSAFWTLKSPGSGTETRLSPYP